MKLSLALLTAGLLVAGTANAQILGSVHDFSGRTWNTSGEICRVCHVPHDHNKANLVGLNGLLWNHSLSTATYTMYTSSYIQGTQDPQPTGVTKLCFGCHDGTVALEDFDGRTGGTNFVFTRIPGANYWTGNVGDLRATHPISITYDEVADPGLAPKNTTMGGSGTIADVLEGGKVQCSSCHDVHRTVGETLGAPLLRVANTASALCLTCHLK